MATQIEASHLTDLISNGEHGSSPEKENDVVQHTGDQLEYATGMQLVAAMCTIFLCTLLSALDLGIVATAIPSITDEFERLDEVGWYGSACFLLVGTSSPLWGKMYKYISARLVYLASIVLFLIGSIVAATAPTSAALIVGRAIQGLGVSGTLSGSILLINYMAEPKRRPILIGLWMGIFMTSTIIGPLIGGAFTSNVTWRWCFWINLPVGGPAVFHVLLFFRVPKHIKPVPASWKEILLQLDLPGFSLLLTSLICYTLALQWGGLSKPWNDGSVIATLVMWIVLTIVFFITEWFQKTYAMVPLRLLKPRITWTNALYGFISNLANFQVLFYLPIYFQSIHDQSAISSGVNSLPFMAFFALGSTFSGFLVSQTRLLQPYQLASGLLSTTGAALLHTLDVNSSKAWYIGSQVVFGIGIGLGNQIPMTALQSFSNPKDVASITGVMLMCNSIAGAYFVTGAQSIFTNRLLSQLAIIDPSINPYQVLATGASDIQRVFRGSNLVAVLDVYMVGIKDVFAFSLAGAAFTVVLALIIPPRKLTSNEEKKAEEKNASALT